uniref:Transmembrane protein 177 n=2 Tax=Lepeophtheirus salmonis TaxID=72036 RepID=A0A0K2UXY0_LEPSM
MSSSRILSQLHKSNWNGYFRRGINQKATNYSNPILRYYEFLQSEQGKKAITIFIPGFSLITSISLVLGDWACLHTYINNFETLEDEEKRRNFNKLLFLKERPLHYSEKMRSLTQEVAKDLKISDKFVNEIRLFRSNSPFPIPLGIQKNNSCPPYIGYPFFTDWISSNDIDLKKNIFKTYWNPLSAKGFEFINVNCTPEDKKIFIFSDNARKFMLGKTILDTDSDRLIIRILLPLLGINGAHFIILILKKRLKNVFRYLPLRMAFYAMVCSSVLSTTLMTYTVASIESEFTHIKTLCSLSEEYRIGGIEYYNKLREINIFLRENIKYGEFYFSENGELSKSWYRLHIGSLNTLLRKEKYCEEFSTDLDDNIFTLLSSA